MKPSLYELLVNEAGLKPSAAHCIEEAFREIINEEVQEAAQESAGIEGRIRDCIREEIRLLETRLKSEVEHIVSKVRYEVRMGELDKAMDAFSKPAAAEAKPSTSTSTFEVNLWKSYLEGRKEGFWWPYKDWKDFASWVVLLLVVVTVGIGGGTSIATLIEFAFGIGKQ